jgi:hypothetical protein
MRRGGRRHRAKFFRPGDAVNRMKIFDRILVGAPGASVGDVGKPSISGGTSASLETRRRRTALRASRSASRSAAQNSGRAARG